MSSVEEDYILAAEEYNQTGELYEEEQLILAEDRMNTFWDIYTACYWQIEDELDHRFIYDLCDLGMDRYASIIYCEECGVMKP